MGSTANSGHYTATVRNSKDGNWLVDHVVLPVLDKIHPHCYCCPYSSSGTDTMILMLAVPRATLRSLAAPTFCFINERRDL